MVVVVAVPLTAGAAASALAIADLSALLPQGRRLMQEVSTAAASAAASWACSSLISLRACSTGNDTTTAALQVWSSRKTHHPQSCLHYVILANNFH
jgi:hypothetical protein